MIAEIDSLSGFWHAVEHSRGATDPKLGKYVVKNWNGEEKNQKLLRDVYSQLTKLVDSNPHFSEKEREVGKKIVRKLDVITQEAKDDWDKAIGFFSRWLKFGLWDYDFMINESKGSAGRVEKIFETYTKEQWKAAFPGKRVPFPYWQLGDGPKRYYLPESESSEE